MDKKTSKTGQSLALAPTLLTSRSELTNNVSEFGETQDMKRVHLCLRFPDHLESHQSEVGRERYG